MIACEGDIARMALQSGDERLSCIIPYLDRLIIRGCEQIWLVRLGVVINMIHPFGLMGLQGVICMAGAEAPDLDRPIQTCRGEGVGVFRIDRQAHDIVAMTFVNLDAFPFFVPIPELYRHVIRGRENERLCGVNDDGANVVGVGFELGDLLGGVVVVDSDLEIVGPADNPVLASNETASSYGDIGKLEGFDNGL